MARDLTQIVANCDRFLSGHDRRSVRELMHSVAASPLSLVRNDQYGAGGVVTQVESEVAELLGKEAAVFMPSGTMAQQIALRIWSDKRGSPKVAFHPTCHLQIHEQMAYSVLHGLTATLIGASDAVIRVADVEALPEDISTLLLELPQREIGGQLPPWDELATQCCLARSKGMRLHMDGARLWECRPYYNRSYAEIASPFDSVYVSCYKILGGLPGAVLAGPADFVAAARIWLRRHGGNLHQQSPSAIAAKLGMDEHLPRIEAYVRKAQEIAAALRTLPEVRVVPEFPPTNMFHIYLTGDPTRLVNAALDVAEQDHVGLFFSLGSDGKLEVSIGSAASRLDVDEIRRLFEKLFRLAALSS